MKKIVKIVIGCVAAVMLGVFAFAGGDEQELKNQNYERKTKNNLIETCDMALLVGDCQVVKQEIEQGEGTKVEIYIGECLDAKYNMVAIENIDYMYEEPHISYQGPAQLE